MTKTRKLTVERLITYRGNSTPGQNVTKFDRAMLLRRLANLTDAFDVLIANGQVDEAMRIRAECVRCLKRLGVSRIQINKLTSARGPLPEYAEIERDEADAASNHEGEDHEAE